MGRVIVDNPTESYRDYMQAGECACVSVHETNRLGTNSLVDLVAFAKHAGLHAAGYAWMQTWFPLPPQPNFALQQLASSRAGDGSNRQPG